MADAVDVRDGGAVPGQGFREFQDVVTLEAVTDYEGRLLPAGSEGTIIDASLVEGWFHVEFDQPFHCVVGLWSKQMRP